MARDSKYPDPQAKIFANRRRNPDAKREAILRSAVQLFLQRSYAGTAMNDIADSLKITKPALYHYFRNKEEILLECYRWGCMLIRESLDEIAATGGNGIDKVAEFIRSYTAVVTVDFGRAVIRLDDTELSPKARGEIRSYKREIDHRLRAFIQQGIDDGSILACDPKLAAFAIAGALNWICTWYQPGGNLGSDQIGEAFAATLTGGLRSRAGSGHKAKPGSGLRLMSEKTGKGSR
jgi:AcrR family transcriptional regulator